MWIKSRIWGQSTIPCGADTGASLNRGKTYLDRLGTTVNGLWCGKLGYLQPLSHRPSQTRPVGCEIRQHTNYGVFWFYKAGVIPIFGLLSPDKGGVIHRRRPRQILCEYNNEAEFSLIIETLRILRQPIVDRVALWSPASPGVAGCPSRSTRSFSREHT